MTTDRAAEPTGSAYDLPTPSWDAELVEVSRGTPSGELLRRYWLPVGAAAEATTLPRRVRARGEDLILFRDKSRRRRRPSCFRHP